MKMLARLALLHYIRLVIGICRLDLLKRKLIRREWNQVIYGWGSYVSEVEEVQFNHI